MKRLTLSLGLLFVLITFVCLAMDGSAQSYPEVFHHQARVKSVGIIPENVDPLEWNFLVIAAEGNHAEARAMFQGDIKNGERVDLFCGDPRDCDPRSSEPMLFTARRPAKQ